MKKAGSVVRVISMVVLGAGLSRLQGQPPNSSFEQQLRSQYRVASVDGNGRVVRAGSVLVVAQDGIKAIPSSINDCWYNSHKPGNGIRENPSA